MIVRRVSAHYIFSGYSKPLKRGIIELDSSGRILNVIDTNGNLEETAALEFYDGILVPGFVNAHAHLELSHLKAKIQPHKGLIHFIGEVGRLRNCEENKRAIVQADQLMRANGIVAVGDISNSTDSFQQKANSKIQYITFIELMGILEHTSDQKIDAGLSLLHQLEGLGQKGYLTPHAPYSVSSGLWQKLTDIAMANSSLWSVHNQESFEETLLFRDGSGGFPTFLKHFGNDYLNWAGKNISSLQHVLSYYSQARSTLLVHNTFTTKSDIQLLKDSNANVTLVLCPNANLYIENKLPDVEMFAASGLPIAIGTDSFASNTNLSVLEEMKTLQGYFPKLTLEQLIGWATLSGAKALGLEDSLGSFEKGKIPGLNLISGIDFREMKLTSEARVSVL